MQSAPLLNHKVQLLRNYFNIFEQCTSFGLILLYPETSPPIAFFKHVALLISGNPLKSQLCCSKQLEIRKLLKFPGKHPEGVPLYNIESIFLLFLFEFVPTTFAANVAFSNYRIWLLFRDGAAATRPALKDLGLFYLILWHLFWRLDFL